MTCYDNGKNKIKYSIKKGYCLNPTIRLLRDITSAIDRTCYILNSYQFKYAE
jgi:hypothetical protein